MAFQFKHSHRVEFYETDMAEIMHFSNYFRLMEATEHAFYLSVGCSVHDYMNGKLVSFPRGQVDCAYYKPLKYDDVIDIHLIVREMRNKTIRYDFSFRKPFDGVVKEAARGTILAICVSRNPEDGEYFSIPIPDSLRAMIEQAPSEALAEFDSFKPARR